MTLAGTKYFLWLYSLVKREEYISYRKMLKVLHSVPYTWFVPNDDNRSGDGVALRERYCEEHACDVTPDLFEEPASVFEVLIALAFRMEDQLYNPEMGNRSSLWFWTFISNLGLNQYSDDRWIYHKSDRDVVDIVERFLDRKYGKDGVGGIFPLRRRPKKDQTKVELWYQMQAYFEENFPN